MFYSTVHILLLLAATCGIWFVRRRRFLFVVGLMLFPLPAALFNFAAAPLAKIAADITAPGCTSSASRIGSRDATSYRETEDDRQDKCVPSARAAQAGHLVVILIINYATVVVGLLAGLLCLASVRHGRRPT